MYLLAGCAGITGLTEEESKWWTGLTYLVGSIFFMLMSLMALWMWKNEHYGLGLISEINVERTEEPKEILSMHEEYGCGRSSATQMPWLWMYLINASASILDVGLAIAFKGSTNHSGNIANRVLSSILNFSLSHGILLLGSVVHHVPRAAPHSWLLIYMRLVLLFYTINSWWSVINEIDGIPCSSTGTNYTDSF